MVMKIQKKIVMTAKSLLQNTFCLRLNIFVLAVLLYFSLSIVLEVTEPYWTDANIKSTVRKISNTSKDVYEFLVSTFILDVAVNVFGKSLGLSKCF